MTPTILVIDPDDTHRSHFKTVLAGIGMAGDFYETPEQLPPGFDIATYAAAVIDLDRTNRFRQLLKSWHKNSKTLRLIGLSRETFHPDLGDIIDRYLFACMKKPVESEELALLLKNITRRDCVGTPGETIHE